MTKTVALLPDNEAVHPDALYIEACLDSLGIPDWQPNRAVWKDLCQVAQGLIGELAAIEATQTDQQLREEVERLRAKVEKLDAECERAWQAYRIAHNQAMANGHALAEARSSSSLTK